MKGKVLPRLISAEEKERKPRFSAKESVISSRWKEEEEEEEEEGEKEEEKEEKEEEKNGESGMIWEMAKERSTVVESREGKKTLFFGPPIMLTFYHVKMSRNEFMTTKTAFQILQTSSLLCQESLYRDFIASLFFCTYPTNLFFSCF